MGDTPLYLQAHFREQVKDTFDTGIQQTFSKFSDAGIIAPGWKPDQVVYRTGAQVTFVETTGQRGGDTQQGEWQAGFRSGFKRDFEAAVQLDRNDQRKLFTANLPTSEIQQEMQMAWHRKWDDVILDASRAASLGGEKPYITPLALPPVKGTSDAGRIPAAVTGASRIQRPAIPAIFSKEIRSAFRCLTEFPSSCAFFFFCFFPASPPAPMASPTK